MRAVSQAAAEQARTHVFGRRAARSVAAFVRGAAAGDAIAEDRGSRARDVPERRALGRV
jgi:hypothetical protein